MNKDPRQEPVKKSENEKKTSSRYLAGGLIAIAVLGFVLLLVPFGRLSRQADRKETNGTSASGLLPVTLAGAGTEGAYGAEDPGSGSAVSGAADSGSRDSEALSEDPGAKLVVTGVTLAAESLRENEKIAVSSVPSAEDFRSDVEENLAPASEFSDSALELVTDNRQMSYNDYCTLLQIVEAEATGGDEKSKLLIANVVLNRVKDPHFPDTVYDVVWQRLYGRAQFSPTQDGRMGTLAISDTTRNAVSRALSGEDISQGALFFLARKDSASSNVKWFDDTLVYLYSYGGHEFFRFKDTEETETESDI